MIGFLFGVVVGAAAMLAHIVYIERGTQMPEILTKPCEPSARDEATRARCTLI